MARRMCIACVCQHKSHCRSAVSWTGAGQRTHQWSHGHFADGKLRAGHAKLTSKAIDAICGLTSPSVQYIVSSAHICNLPMTSNKCRCSAQRGSPSSLTDPKFGSVVPCLERMTVRRTCETSSPYSGRATRLSRISELRRPWSLRVP